jgi:hypothetical protein
MIIFGNKLYIYLLMFALCSFVGNLCEQLFYMIDGGRGKRGIMDWPVSTMYGIDGVLAILVTHFASYAGVRLVILIAIFIGMNALSIVLSKALSGVRMWRYDRVGCIFGAVLFSVLCLFGVVPLIDLFETIPAAVELIILLAFYTIYISKAVDAVDKMHKLKIILNNKMTLDEHQRHVLADLYRRWIKAYPMVRQAMSESFRRTAARES